MSTRTDDVETKKYTITFEVDATTTPEQLHEMLCIQIHENVGRTAEIEEIQMSVLDISESVEVK